MQQLGDKLERVEAEQGEDGGRQASTVDIKLHGAKERGQTQEPKGMNSFLSVFNLALANYFEVLTCIFSWFSHEPPLNYRLDPYFETVT